MAIWNIIEESSGEWLSWNNCAQMVPSVRSSIALADCKPNFRDNLTNSFQTSRPSKNFRSVVVTISVVSSHSQVLRNLNWSMKKQISDRNEWWALTRLHHWPAGGWVLSKRVEPVNQPYQLFRIVLSRCDIYQHPIEFLATLIPGFDKISSISFFLKKYPILEWKSGGKITYKWSRVPANCWIIFTIKFLFAGNHEHWFSINWVKSQIRLL